MVTADAGGANLRSAQSTNELRLMFIPNLFPSLALDSSLYLSFIKMMEEGKRGGLPVLVYRGRLGGAAGVTARLLLSSPLACCS